MRSPIFSQPFQRKKTGVKNYAPAVEGDTVLISYEDIAEYVKLAVIRYLQGCSVKEKRERIERIIQNTIFSSAMDLIAQTPPSGIPLVYG